MVFSLEFVLALFGSVDILGKGHHSFPFEINLPAVWCWARSSAEYTAEYSLGLGDWLRMTMWR